GKRGQQPGAGPAPGDRPDPVTDESDEPSAEQIQPIEPGADAPHALSANDKGDPPTGPLATVGLATPASRDVGWISPSPNGRPKPAGVLWVDDHPENNVLEMDQLQRRGVPVDTARSTQQALEQLTSRRYQIIVSDMDRV